MATRATIALLAFFLNYGRVSSRALRNYPTSFVLYNNRRYVSTVRRPWLLIVHRTAQVQFSRDQVTAGIGVQSSSSKELKKILRYVHLCRGMHLNKRFLVHLGQENASTFFLVNQVPVKIPTGKKRMKQNACTRKTVHDTPPQIPAQLQNLILILIVHEETNQSMTRSTR